MDILLLLFFALVLIPGNDGRQSPKNIRTCQLVADNFKNNTRQYGIVPNYADEIETITALEVVYPESKDIYDDKAGCGNFLSANTTDVQPVLTLNGTGLDCDYLTIVFFQTNYTSTNNTFLIWEVNNVKTKDLENSSLGKSSTVLYEYIQPTTVNKTFSTDLHPRATKKRIFFVYCQPGYITPAVLMAAKITIPQRSQFKPKEFASALNLGQPYTTNYFVGNTQYAQTYRDCSVNRFTKQVYNCGPFYTINKRTGKKVYGGYLTRDQ